MVLDINDFRTDRGGNPDKVREALQRRFKPVEWVDEVIELDGTWRQLQGKIDLLQRDHRKASKEFGTFKKNKQDVPEELTRAIADIAEQIEKTKLELQETADKRDRALGKIPNYVDNSVPVSNDEANNKVERVFGTCGSGKFNHVDLMYMADMSDTEKGSSVAGNRGYYLKGAGVLLNQALINYAMAFLYKRKYTYLQTPFFMQKDIMGEVAQLEQFDEELYKVSGEGEDKYLIATSEQPTAAYHRGDWMDPKTLPIRYCSYSTCFRKEVGSHGRDTLGIFRIHQFEKVEQFLVTSPEDGESWKAFDEMIASAEEFYQSLGLPYQVVNIVSGELNNAAAKKNDLEAWFPASQTYRELVSCSNCLDYQSRRLEVRYGQSANKKAAGQTEKKYVHMLNSTLCATERTMCAIVENYQTDTGIRVPEVLQPFMMGIQEIPFVRGAPKIKDKKDKVKKETVEGQLAKISV